VGAWRARWAVAVVAVSLLALTACGRPPGVDGNLTNNWPTLPTPQMQVPVVGQCLQGFSVELTPSVSRLKTVDCSAFHILEVVYVGRFGATASGTTAPPADSDDVRTALTECGHAARDYLGGDWHDTGLVVRYSPPSAAQWSGGARFFFCSLLEMSMQGGVGGRTGTAKGGLNGNQPLAMSCFDQAGTTDADGFYAEVQDIFPAKCDERHTAEYAGTYYPHDEPYPTETDMERLWSGCMPVVASFLGLSPAGFGDRQDIAYVAWNPNKDQWSLGDRALKCFAVVSTKNPVRGSLKLLGHRPLPG
jgi:hypothetical protein